MQLLRMQFEENTRVRDSQAATAHASQAAELLHKERMMLLDRRMDCYAAFRTLIFDRWQLYNDDPPVVLLGHVYGIAQGVSVKQRPGEVAGVLNRKIMETLQTIGLVGSAEVKAAAGKLAEATYSKPDHRANDLLSAFWRAARADLDPQVSPSDP
ncbi:hypothetical protein L083_0751 [Actinoplanes sp. N902-109]|nr:hypothetical protein L083_0751 [Actinoplanes sp. N902-109]